MERKPTVIQSAAAMSAGTLASRILGYVRDVAVLTFLTRFESDAFVVAFRLPNLIRRLLGEGSLAVSFLPVFVSTLESPASVAYEDRRARASALSNAVFTLLSALVMTLTVLAFIYMEPFLNLWVGGEKGFTSVPGKLELTVTLARIMIVFMFLVTTYAYLMSIANAIHRFFWPALAPAIFNATIIVFAWLPQQWFSGFNTWVRGQGLAEGSQAMATDLNSVAMILSWGVVAGGILQTAIVAAVLWRTGLLPRLTLRLRVDGVRSVLQALGPGLIGLGVFQLMTIANTSFAARLKEGAQTYIYAGDRILELPQSLIAISLGAALLPTMSRQVALGEIAQLLATARRTLEAMLFLALPSAIGMALIAHPVVQVLFQRKEFTSEDVVQTATVIQIYSVLLLASSVAKVTVPAFYAKRMTWVPAAVAGGVLLVHVTLGQWMVHRWGIEGLAAATALASTLNMLVIQIWFSKTFGSLGWSSVGRSVVRMLPGLGGMSAWLLLMPGVLDGFEVRFLRSGAPLGLLILIMGAVVVYFAVAHWMGCKEANQIVGTLRRKLKI